MSIQNISDWIAPGRLKTLDVEKNMINCEGEYSRVPCDSLPVNMLINEEPKKLLDENQVSTWLGHCFFEGSV